MAQLGRFWLVSLSVLALTVAGGAIGLSLFWGNESATAEKAKLDTELNAAQARLNSSPEGPDIEAMRKRLDEVRSAIPTRAGAEDAITRLWQYAKEAGLSILYLDSADTTSIEAEGEAGSITAFLQALPRLTPSPVVEDMELAQIKGKENIWGLRLKLSFQYGEGQ